MKPLIKNIYLSSITTFNEEKTADQGNTVKAYTGGQF